MQKLYLNLINQQIHQIKHQNNSKQKMLEQEEITKKILEESKVQARW